MNLEKLIKDEFDDFNINYDDIGSDYIDDRFSDVLECIENVINKNYVLQPIISESEGNGVCYKCRDTEGFYLGMTCPECKRPFRSVISDER